MEAKKTTVSSGISAKTTAGQALLKEAAAAMEPASDNVTTEPVQATESASSVEAAVAANKIVATSTTPVASAKVQKAAAARAKLAQLQSSIHTGMPDGNQPSGYRAVPRRINWDAFEPGIYAKGFRTLLLKGQRIKFGEFEAFPLAAHADKKYYKKLLEQLHYLKEKGKIKLVGGYELPALESDKEE